MPFLQNRDDSIYYVVDLAKEKEDAETILMLHNNITDHTLFDRLLPYLNKMYTVIRYDLRGFGQSSRGTKNLSYDQYAEDLQFMIDSLHLEHFHLVGTGFSAIIAARYTFYHQTMIKSLILLSMPCNPPHTIHKVREHRKKISQSGTKIPVDYIIQMGSSLPSDHPFIVKWRKIITQTDPDTYFKIMDLAISGEPLSDLIEMHVPTLILSGEKDRLFPQHYLKASINPLPHCLHITIPGASSFIVMDKPEITALLMLDFIKERQAQSPNKDEFVTSLYEEIRKFSDHSQVETKNSLKVNLLQSFRVYVNGQELTDGWNKRSARPILIYLLFHQPSTREQLCEALWPEKPLHQSKKNLSVYLSYLKSLLNTSQTNDPILVTDREHIHFNGEVTSDALDFMTLLKRASEEKDAKIKFLLCQELLNRLPMAFTPATYEDWFISLMSQGESRLIHLILWMADWLIQSGQKHQALQHLKTYMKLFNDDELLYDKLMEHFGKQ